MIDVITINTFLVFSVFLAGLEQIYETFVVGSRKDKGELRGEKWTIVGMGFFHILMFLGTFIEYFITRKHLNLVVSFVGLVLYLSGVTLRYWTIHTLGRFWSIHIEIRENQPLIRGGPYRFMRHPAYFALFLKVPSVPLILNSYYACFLVLFTYCPLVLIRLYYEEIELFKKFRKTYVRYRKGKWALFPLLKGQVVSPFAGKVRWLTKLLLWPVPHILDT